MPKKRRRNKQFEARQIQLLRWRFERARHEVDDHFKVGKLPLEIDLIVIRRVRQKKRAAARLPRLFAYFRRYKDKKPIMDAMLDLYESEVNKLMALYETSPKTLRRHLEAIGKERVIAAIRKDELLAALSKKDMIAAMGGKKRLIKSLLVDLAPAERQKLLAQLNGNGASPRQSSK